MAMNCMTGLQAATTNQQKITTMTQQWQLLSLQTTQYAICIFMHVCNHADQTDSVMPWPLVKPLRLFANLTSVCFIYKVTGQWACSPEHDWATNDMETMFNSKLYNHGWTTSRPWVLCTQIKATVLEGQNNWLQRKLQGTMMHISTVLTTECWWLPIFHRLRADCKNAAQISTQLSVTQDLSLHSTIFIARKLCALKMSLLTWVADLSDRPRNNASDWSATM